MPALKLSFFLFCRPADLKKFSRLPVQQKIAFTLGVVLVSFLSTLDISGSSVSIVNFVQENVGWGGTSTLTVMPLPCLYR